jgi:hypothetical protein
VLAVEIALLHEIDAATGAISPSPAAGYALRHS